jgi:hypothetical protein
MEENRVSRGWLIAGLIGGLIAIIFSTLTMTGHSLHALLRHWNR